MRVSVITLTYDGGTVAEAMGTDMETGDLIRFAGDHRPMMAIAEALAGGDDVEVEVEDWQILRGLRLSPSSLEALRSER